MAGDSFLSSASAQMSPPALSLSLDLGGAGFSAPAAHVYQGSSAGAKAEQPGAGGRSVRLWECGVGRALPTGVRRQVLSH